MRTFLATTASVRFIALIVAVICTSICTSTNAFAQSDEAVLKAKESVQKAAITGDVASLNAAQQEAKTAVAAAASAATKASKKAAALYYVGYANYSLAVLPSQKESSERHADAGIQALEEAITLEPNFADAHALLASLYGRKAAGGMMAGMKYGQKSTAAMERAVALAPNNPRTLMLQGISLFYTPAIWGGDKKKALTNLQKACDLAEKGACAANDATMPDWGHAEAFAWKGAMFAQADESDTDNAKAAYDRALQLEPNYAWVKFVLLPKLAAK